MREHWTRVLEIAKPVSAERAAEVQKALQGSLPNEIIDLVNLTADPQATRFYPVSRTNRLK